jgi:hypothetical protein
MAKTLFMGKHTDGNVYTVIYSGTNGTGTQDLIANPLNRINEVFFHSSFGYLKSNTSGTYTVTLPVRTSTQVSGKKKGRTVTRPSYGSAQYTLTTTDYTAGGFPPNIIAVETNLNRTITGTTVLQQPNGDTIRYITVGADASGIYVDEQYFAYSASLPSITITLKVYVITNPVAQTDPGRAVRIEPSVVKVNNGVFNSDLGYVKVKSGYSLGGTTTSYTETSNSYYEEVGSLRRVWKYNKKQNELNIGWDAFERYDGVKEGLWYKDITTAAATLENQTSWYNPDDGWTYYRGTQQEDVHDFDYTYDMWYLKRNTTTGVYFDPAVEGNWVFSKTYTRSSKLGIEDIDWKVGTNAVAYGPPSVCAAASATYGQTNGTDFRLANGRPFQCIAVSGVNAGRAFAYRLKSITDLGTMTRGYAVYRSRSVPVNTGRAGAAFVNGPTINLVNTPGGVSTGVAFYYDGIKNNYGDTVGYPTNTVFGAKLI